MFFIDNCLQFIKSNDRSLSENRPISLFSDRLLGKLLDILRDLLRSFSKPAQLNMKKSGMYLNPPLENLLKQLK